MSTFHYLVSRALPFVPRALVGAVARRYIAGETLGDAVRVLRVLAGDGCLGTVDVLGEEVHRREIAAAAVDEYLRALRALRDEGLPANISVKLTQLGLKLDHDFCFSNLASLVGEARGLGSFVRIDMEDSSCTDPTLDLYRRLRQEGFDNVGVVLQACLRRTLADARSLPEGASVRLCKGIYIEPRAIAHRDPEIVRHNFVRVLETLLDRGCHVGIATHDEWLVWQACRAVEDRSLAHDRYEFQMLLGVDEPLRRIILSEAHRLRVYVPYGPQWYAYSLRRLKENPNLAGHVLKGVLGRSGH